MAILIGLMMLVTGNAHAAGWTCTAIGYEPSYGGSPGQRRYVSGPEMSTQASAQTHAVQLCMASGLMMCGVGSCVEIPFGANAAATE